MPDVVEQRRQANELAKPRPGASVEPPRRVARQRIEDAPAEVHGADAVEVPIVDGAREHILGETELFDTAEALKQRCVDDGEFGTGDRDGAVHRVAQLDDRGGVCRAHGPQIARPTLTHQGDGDGARLLALDAGTLERRGQGAHGLGALVRRLGHDLLEV